MPLINLFSPLFPIAAKKKQHSPSPDYSVESDYSEDQEDAEDYRHGKPLFFFLHKSTGGPVIARSFSPFSHPLLLNSLPSY